MAKRIAIVNTKRCKKRDFIKKLGKTEIIFTKHAGHATDIAKNSKDYDTIIAVGGDGTISEVVNGMDLKNQKLAILPMGSGNSLARDLSILSRRKVLNGTTNDLAQIDLVDCSFKIKNKKFRRYVVTTTGIGFICRVVNFANNYIKSARSLSYPVSASFMLFNQDVFPARIKIDEASHQEVRFTSLVVNNTMHAGNFRVFPKAILSDSLLNLVFAKTNALTQFMTNLSLLTRGDFYNPGVRKEIKKLDIKLHKPAGLMLDGEIVGPVEEVEYSVMPKALKLAPHNYLSNKD